MRVRLFSAALVFVLSTLTIAAAVAAGSVTLTRAAGPYGIQKLTLSWTSSGGAVSGNTFTPPGGELLQVKFIPGANSAQPTDLYDMTLVDSDGVDYLAGLGANLSNAAASVVVPRASTSAARFYLDGSSTLDLVVANAGNAKSGTVILWIGR